MTSSEKVTVFAGAKPIGPYSPAIRQGNMLFASGQIGANPETGKLVEGGVEAEARQMLENLKNLISSGGSSLEKVVKTTLFLTNIADFAAVNKIYAEYFGPVFPARSTVQVNALPGGALVEVEAMAFI
jgi:2-iminobutanoate/2-iminopropanoate deaminase